MARSDDLSAVVGGIYLGWFTPTEGAAIGAFGSGFAALLSVPIFFPVITGLDFGMTEEQVAIWFGILIVVEVGLITPPVGMNLFVINAMDRKTFMIETYKSVLIFIGSDLVRVVILVLFPVITLLFILG